MSTEISTQVSGGSEELSELHSRLKDAVIMMVDDEPIMMEVLQTFLEMEDYTNFVTVEDSTKAMSVLNETTPDILLLDLKMPIVDGFEILQRVRSHPALKRLPVIMLTSSSDSETKLKALEMGATDFLAKPVDSSELALRLRNTLTVKAYQDRLTYYDSLTGLPNRVRFTDMLNWKLKSAGRSEDAVAVINLSLDRFKQIRDTLGPMAGDELLKQTAERLSGTVRDSDVVSFTGRDKLWQQMARLGGDEFSILLSGGLVAEDAAYVAKRLLSAVKDVYQIDGQDIFITASIGIATFPNDATETDALLQNASAAAEVAKQQGQGGYQFYSSEMNQKAKQRLQVESELRYAIEKNEFRLHYQPKVDLTTNRVVGMESLIRWQHPERGLLSPFFFIDIAEQTGMIVEIGRWVMEEACRQAMEWHRKGLNNLKVSVNVCAQQLLDNELMKAIEDALSQGLSPKHLVVEITESALVGDEERIISILNQVKALGPYLSIDDFGTGYSSLSYLKRFPVDELKIDRSFLLDVPREHDDCAIVKAIIAMAKILDLSLVAEGVEEQPQLDFLADLDCNIIQGFYFSKPLAPDEFEAFVRERNGVAS